MLGKEVACNLNWVKKEVKTNGGWNPQGKIS